MMRHVWPIPLAAFAAVWSIVTGNNTAFIVSLYLGVIWVGVLMHRADAARNRRQLLHLNDLELRRVRDRHDQEVTL